MGHYELSERDKNNPHNAKLEGSPAFKVGEHRRCTDMLFSLLLIASWAAMTFLGLVVVGIIDSPEFEAGNPKRLVNGIDNQGHICGVDKAVADLDKFYPVPSGTGVCVASCPKEDNYERFYCINDTTIEAAVYNPGNDTFNAEVAWQYVAQGDCMYYAASTDLFNYCVFDAAISAMNTTAASAAAGGSVGAPVMLPLTNSASWLTDLAADLIASKALVLGISLGGSALLAFIYICLMRVPALLFLLVWACALGILAVFIGAGLVLMDTAQAWDGEPEPQTHSDSEAKALLYFSYVLFALGGLWALLLLWLRKRINTAICVTKEAARAVNSMPLLLFFPIIQTLGLLIFLVPWAIYVVYLASSGTITPVETPSGATVKAFSYSDNDRYAGLYLIFCYFWTSEYILALGQIVVAMSVATWYFTREKGSIGSRTVLRSIGSTLYYHAGTAAFGSLVIAIIKTIRTVIAYLQKKAKDSHNKLLSALLCCIQCCMWCLEKCMKFLNKNAYIQTAIFGYSFCKAARKAFFLIARNILRVAAVGMVSELVAILGLILVPLASALAYYLAAQELMADKMHGLIGPTIIVGIIAFIVAHMFTQVFGMAISTILQCFIADEEMFEPGER
ncbi:plasma-membrane choline transporter-domain-containing protein [Tribonema minus]|uniref:Choline transporter-like protein n=1 Tax=Tribonema minus TaxID=303371 RepID=A0A835Z9G9_9STRA|nr:plasma-membrane choline transporter-domain-containing protein [Tribonema minus]